LEQCSLDRWDQSGNVWLWWTMPCLVKTKQHIGTNIQSSKVVEQRKNELGFFSVFFLYTILLNFGLDFINDTNVQYIMWCCSSENVCTELKDLVRIWWFFFLRDILSSSCDCTSLYCPQEECRAVSVVCIRLNVVKRGNIHRESRKCEGVFSFLMLSGDNHIFIQT